MHSPGPSQGIKNRREVRPEGPSKTEINSKSILSDSRIIKILRYSICPSISQMKFGQFFGINSIEKFEND